MPANKPLNVAILISGGGTTMQAIIQACQSGELSGINPAVVIASRPDAGGILKAQALGIPTVLAGDLLEFLDKYQIDLVSQNGWLPLTPLEVINKYPSMIINQHPGPLDPGRGNDFGGQGMYGARVFCATLIYTQLTKQDFDTELTTHFVTKNFDEGDLIRVTKSTIKYIPDLADFVSATQKLQSELLPLEHQNVIATLKLFQEGSVNGYRRSTPLIPTKNIPYLNQAKQLAIKLFPHG